MLKGLKSGLLGRTASKTSKAIKKGYKGIKKIGKGIKKSLSKSANAIKKGIGKITHPIHNKTFKILPYNKDRTTIQINDTSFLLNNNDIQKMLSVQDVKSNDNVSLDNSGLEILNRHLFTRGLEISLEG